MLLNRFLESEMKKLIIIILCTLFFSCASLQQAQQVQQCPPENAYFMTLDGIPIYMPKNWFNEFRDNWLDEEQYQDIIKDKI